MEQKLSLNDLLAQCDPSAPRDATEQAWLDAVSVGLECVEPSLFIDKKINPAIFLQRMSSIFAEYSKKGIQLEIGDLANEIGILLGQETADKQSLKSEFRFGFSHGVDLTEKHRS